MSKIIKGVTKVVKKVFKSVKKVFKKVIESPLGKVLMVGAAIYTGGVFFGAWGEAGPLSGMFGAFGSGAPAAAGGAITSPMVPLAPEIGVSAMQAAGAAPAVASIAPAAAVSAAAPVVELGAGVAMQGATTQAPGLLASTGNLLSESASGIMSFANANPMLTAMGLQGVAGALAPDEIDIMREEEKIRKSRFESLSGVGSIDLSGLPTQATRQGIPWHERLKQIRSR